MLRRVLETSEHLKVTPVHHSEGLGPQGCLAVAVDLVAKLKRTTDRQASLVPSKQHSQVLNLNSTKENCLVGVDGPLSKHRSDHAIEQDSEVTTLATQTAPALNQVALEAWSARHTTNDPVHALKSNSSKCAPHKRKRHKQKSFSSTQA